MVDWRDEDPGLPIKLGPVSNGEFLPEPLSPTVTEALRAAREQCDRAADRLSIDRREFLKMAAASAITLYFLDRFTSRAEAHPGGRFVIPRDALWEPAAAEVRLSGDEFIMDVQGHLLEYDLNPATRGRRFWGSQFPQMNCGDDDPRACFSMTHFMEEMFLRSDTSMAVVSALPIHPEGSPLPIEVMDETRRVALGLSRDDRILLHAQALPQVGSIDATLEEMEATAARYPVAGWKTFTHFRDPQTGNRFWLDDHEAGMPQVGRAFIEKSLELGINIICVHKGLSGGDRYSSPVDIGAVARDYPDMNFVVYHCGFEVSGSEGPYTDSTRDVGVNRLISSLVDNGIEPGSNVYGELGSTWWYLMRTPTQAAHVLGKLLTYLGEDRILWGTDSIFYGSPQDQIEAMRAFEITPSFRDRYQYPKLTPYVKRKIFGLNAADLYGVEPVRRWWSFDRDDIRDLRRTFPDGNKPWGPATMEEFRRFHEYHQGWA
ncbi:MAG TPA: amidohydrolase family protein [Acidimicrobiia bacterium]|nr:amidohydrolase family protein [Acidimicrobiia bacterium]